jgi:glucose-1-phosphate cytidylyltransferase
MIEIGGKPILWHILKLYSYYGINEFVICLGYKGYVIKEYFANYFLHMSDVTFDMASNRMEVRQQYAEPWRITLVDTGGRDHDWRSIEAGKGLHRRRDILFHLRRRRIGHRHRQDDFLPSPAQEDCHRGGYSAAGPVWRSQYRS